MIISKKYPIQHLCQDLSSILERCEKINHYFKEKQNIPYFVIENGFITRQAIKIQHKNKKINKNQYQLLKKEVELIHSFGLTHGDINFNNILNINEETISLIDFEPSLIQIKNNRTTLMYTPGWISPIDLSKKQITELTDQFCLNKIFTLLNN